MTKKEDHKFVDEDKLFGEAARIPSEGAFPSFFIPFTDFSPNRTIQIRAKLTMSDGSVVFTDAVTFDTPVVPEVTTTTTTTTTDSPLATIYDITDLSDCPCGIVELPAGSAYQSTAGLSMRLVDSDLSFLDVPLLHNQSVSIEKENKFTTVTNYITENISPTKLILFIDTDLFFRLVVENIINITVKSMNTKKILYNKPFGALNRKTKIRSSEEIDKPSIVLDNISSDDLKDDALIININSFCDYRPKPCCDSLPENIQVFSSGSVCLPLTQFYPDDVNPVTTTTPQPDTVIFENVAGASVDSEVQLTAKISTAFGSDINYFIELKESDYHVRLSSKTSAKSGDTITYTDKSFGTALKYRIAVISPTISYSDYINVSNNLVTTTFHPDPELTTSYTTPPPPATPSITNVSLTDGFGGQDWVLTWNANNDLNEMSDLRLEWRYKNNALSDNYNNTSWNEVPVTIGSNPTGLTKTISGIDGCEIIEWRLGVVDCHQLTWSANYEFVNGTLPGPVRILNLEQVSTNLNSSWTEPSSLGSCSRSNILYIVEYVDQSNYTGPSTTFLSASSPSHSLSSDSVTHTISSVNASSQYLVRVKVRSPLGDGPWVTVGPDCKLMCRFESTITEGTGNNAAEKFVDNSAFGNHMDFVNRNITSRCIDNIEDYNGISVGYVVENGSSLFSPSTKKFGSSSFSTVLVDGSGSPAADNLNIALGGITCADIGGIDYNSSPGNITSNDPVFEADGATLWFPAALNSWNYGEATITPNNGDNLNVNDNSKGTIEFFFKLANGTYSGSNITTKMCTLGFMPRYNEDNARTSYPWKNSHWYNGSDYGIIDNVFPVELEVDFANGVDPQLYLKYSQRYVLEIWNNSSSSVPDLVREYNVSESRNLLGSLDNDWHHYVIQIDNTKNNATDNEFIQVYIDGQRVFSGSTPATVYNTHPEYGDARIGDAIETNGYFQHEWMLNFLGLNVDHASFVDGGIDWTGMRELPSIMGYYDDLRFMTGLVYCNNTFTVPTQTLDINEDTGCS